MACCGPCALQPAAGEEKEEEEEEEGIMVGRSCSARWLLGRSVPQEQAARSPRAPLAPMNLSASPIRSTMP